jgi:hypothetical protein
MNTDSNDSVQELSRLRSENIYLKQQLNDALQRLRGRSTFSDYESQHELDSGSSGDQRDMLSSVDLIVSENQSIQSVELSMFRNLEVETSTTKVVLRGSETGPISSERNLTIQSTSDDFVMLHLRMIYFEAILFVYYYVVLVPFQMLWFLSSHFWNLLASQKEVVCVTSTASKACVYAAQAVAVKFSAVWMARGYVHSDLVAHEFGPSISFAGGGMMWTYYLGVSHYIFETYDCSKVKFFASSGGCFCCIPLVMGMDPYDWCRRDWPFCLEVSALTP